MKRLLLLTLFGIFGCAAAALPQNTPDSISGTIQLDPNTPPEQQFGMHRSEFFDPHKTRLSAEAAEQAGQFERAFHDYWAACDAGMVDSCLRAALLADTRIVDGIPGAVIKHLYNRACVDGLEDACRVAATWDEVIE